MKEANNRVASLAALDLQNYGRFGLGIGHVSKVGGVVVNALIEPQYTLLRHGRGQPVFQVFSA